eukprot:3070438-Alexandrium_andersonii.AAC.1
MGRQSPGGAPAPMGQTPQSQRTWAQAPRAARREEVGWSCRAPGDRWHPPRYQAGCPSRERRRGGPLWHGRQEAAERSWAPAQPPKRSSRRPADGGEKARRPVATS